MPVNVTTPDDLAPLDARITALEAAEPDPTDPALEARVTELETRVTQLGEVDTEHSEALSVLNERATGADDRLAALEGRVTTLEGRPTGGGVDVSRLGVRTLDDFSGASDGERFVNGLAAQAQLTGPKWTLVLPNRAITVNATIQRFNGMRLSGPLGGYEREFSGSGREQCIVLVANPNGLFTVPSTVTGGSEQGIQYRAAGSGVRYEVANSNLASGPILQDHVWRSVAWNGFAGVATQRWLRCSLERFYDQAGTGDQFVLAGSDSYVGMEGNSYVDSQAMPATGYYFRFTHMSRFRFGEVYITPDYGTAVRLDGSYGDFHFVGTKFDTTNRGADRARNPAVVIKGGHGYTFERCWFYNLAAAPARTGEKGNVFIDGGSDHDFNGCTWAGGTGTGGALATGASLVPIYVNNGARVGVTAPKFIGGMPAALQYRTGLADPYLRPLRSDVTVSAA